jgi:hypothetical protein
MTDSEKLLRDLKRGAKQLGLTMGYLAHKALKNGNLPERLKAGGQVRHSTAAKLRAFIAAEIARIQ